MVTKSLELQKHESTQPEVGEEPKFALAIRQKKINELPEVKLREALRYCMILVGLRGNNFPVGVEKSLLLNHVHENYGNHTPEEIRLAFDMAVSAKLDLEEKDVKCYENFSCAYFSQIMNAYRRWAREVYDQQKGKSEVKQIEDKPDLEQIEKEYQEFLSSPVSQKYKPNL